MSEKRLSIPAGRKRVVGDGSIPVAFFEACHRRERRWWRLFTEGQLKELFDTSLDKAVRPNILPSLKRTSAVEALGVEVTTDMDLVRALRADYRREEKAQKTTEKRVGQ